MPLRTARTRLITSALALSVVGAFSGAAFAVDGFVDVPDDDPFSPDIEWMAENGITRGCNPDNTRYCPEEALTREQMAAFLHRLALAQIVDAGKLEGMTLDEILAEIDARTGGTSGGPDWSPEDMAPNSDMLDGLDSTAFLQAEDTASNSEMLGGATASQFWKKSDDVDADTVDGFHASAFWKKIDDIDAATLDGLDSLAFLKVSDLIDADTLDGLDSLAFVKVSDLIDADTLDGLEVGDFLKVGDSVDADTVDGFHADAFWSRSEDIDAATLDGLDSGDFLGSSDQAADADLLDGLDSTDFVRVGGDIDAATLDGLDSTDFVQVGGDIDAATLDGLDSTDFVQVGGDIDAATLNGSSSSAFLSATIETVTETTTQVGELAAGVTAVCPTGTMPIAGGFESSGVAGLNLTDNHPTDDGWRVQGTATILSWLTVYAICVTNG